MCSFHFGRKSQTSVSSIEGNASQYIRTIKDFRLTEVETGLTLTPRCRVL
ncbi:CD180 antigen [Biomphalaria pfeifferi]|uniref:CD180 antigen n=1 Tax=Biomphalaria pfeifferi TaxID=112525 RepID=A0AAD8FJT3_BIOPF|nr:CD180 antigen [Biomphalaria pfeifferi]